MYVVEDYAQSLLVLTLRFASESRSRAIVPVAANDQVIDEIQKSSFDKVDFIKLVMKLVEKEQKVGFCHVQFI